MSSEVGPHKKRGAHLETRSSNPTPRFYIRRACQFLRAFQRPFGWLFWALEQRIAELDVEIERRRS
jgi:hypothetical protein